MKNPKIKKILIALVIALILLNFSYCGNLFNLDSVSNNTLESEFESLSLMNSELNSELSELRAENDRLERIVDEENNGVNIIKLRDQNTYSVGGKVNSTSGVYDPIKGYNDPKGQTSHTDHANVFYQIPVEYNNKNVVMLPPSKQTRITYMTTPDGRDGFNNLFLKNRFGVYLVDLPRTGEASQTSKDKKISTETNDQSIYTSYRIGEWPDVYSGSKFPNSESDLNQFFRQINPSTGDRDLELETNAISELFDNLNDAVLLTHSDVTDIAWNVAKTNKNVRAIIAIEPSHFVFPEGKAPTTKKIAYKNMTITSVSEDDFKEIISRPIVFYFGDNIPNEVTDVPVLEYYVELKRYANEFCDLVNEYGGDCKIVDLPSENIAGNSAMMHLELNNEVIANNMIDWINSKELASFYLTTRENIEETEESSNEEVETSVVEEVSIEDAETVQETIVESETVAASVVPISERKTLVAYFSWGGDSANKANYILGKTIADLFQIKPITAYPTEYDACFSQALKEKEDNARPSIDGAVSNMESYTDIILCYPIWCESAPMVVATFLNQYDFTGKNIYCISQSTDMDTKDFVESVDFLKTQAGNAVFHDGLYSSVNDPVAIDNYLTNKGFIN